MPGKPLIIIGTLGLSVTNGARRVTVGCGGSEGDGGGGCARRASVTDIVFFLFSFLVENELWLVNDGYGDGGGGS